MSGKRRRGRDYAVLERPASPPVATVTLGRTPTRRELRAARRRRRQRWLGAGVLVVLAAVAATVLLLVTHRGGHRAAAPPGRTQHTLLVQVTAGKSAVGSVLIAHDSKTKQGVEVLVPSRVVTEVTGYGSHPFGQVIGLPGGARLSRAGLGDLMHVAVDGSWVLDRTALARLVDRLGGVTVDVDVQVVSGGKVLATPGRQRLSGASAVGFANYVAPGEDPTASLPRLQEVVEAVASELPSAQAGVSALAALGAGSQSSWPAPQLVDFLKGFAGDLTTNSVYATQLPVDAVDTGGPTSFIVDVPKVRTLVQTQLAASVPKGSLDRDNAVFIYNAVGTPGLGSRVRDRLVKSGFRVVGDANQLPFGRPHSVVVIYSSTPAAQQVGQRVAHALGLPASAVEVGTQGQNVADVVVIVGRDYKP